MGSSKSLAVFAAGAALMVSGCTGGGEPEADPTPILPESSEPADPSPSPSESEAADAEPPEMPDAARERSFDGAEAFIEYWAETFTHALNTGDTEDLSAISDPGCASCNGTREVIEDVYGEGGEIRSDGWTVADLGFTRNSVVNEPVVRFERGREVVTRNGADPETFPPAEITFTFYLRHARSGWIIDDYTPVE